MIQSFLSLISTTDTLQGVEIPGTGGDDQLRHTLKVLGFADDLIIFLRNTRQLNEFKRLLNIYEDGSGALNSWSKTFGMRVGSLRDSTDLPQGWEEGRDINTTSPLIRYLGIFLGAPERIARKWEETVTAKMEKRYERWVGRGMPRSRRGRNIVIKNHVQSCAWYLVQSQTPPNLPQMLEKWQRYAWNFFEAPANAEGLHQARRHAVKRETLIQERPEGGQHCQDIEIFTRSLYQRQVSRLVRDCPSGWCCPPTR